MTSIDRLFNYTLDVLAEVASPDDPMTNNEENHPVPPSWVAVAEAVPCAVQERSAREQTLLSGSGPVQSTHKVYCRAPSFEGTLDEQKRLQIDALDLTLEVIAVRDGGGRGDHLEIDALEFRP